MSTPQNICRYFSATGNCFYGDQCNFIHVRPEVATPPATATTPVAATTTPSPAKPKNQVPCKNIAMYGFCKFLGKGCEYNHDVKPEDIAALQQSGVTSILKRPEKSDLTSQFQNLSVSPEDPQYSDQFAQYKSAKPFTPRSTPGVGTTRGGTTYFFGAEPPQPQQPPIQLQYNPTASALPHTANARSQGRRPLSSFFMNEDLRQDFLRRNSLIYTQVEDNRYKDLPQVVHRYHTLYPLDNPSRPTNAAIFGYPSSVYKAFSSVDGLPYVLRKMEGFRLSNEHALRMGELWRQIQHPNIVGLHEIFISKDFGDVNALFFAFNYHPGSETLEERYFGMLNQDYFVPEPVLWSYICQLVSALRAIHGAGLACKVIVPSKIILTGKNKIRVNCVGIQDVVNYDGNKNVAHYQHEDLIALGRLILSIACRTPNAVHNVVKSIEYLGTRYSIELKNFLVYLLKPNTISYPSIEDIVPMISGRLLMEIEHLNTYTDLLESDLSKELENGRLFRLLVKLGCINERPEFDMDPSWSETGDRYLLKLFRDYVFHQTYEDSTPVIDYAHMVECLNKLDAGVSEKIVLMSRDEQSLLIVSYKDLRRCTEEAFNELMMKARRHESFQ